MRPVLVVAAATALAAAACSGRGPSAAQPPRPSGPTGIEVSGGPTGTYLVPAGIHKIKHVVVFQQENRSFDSYFGTFPGADGIPMRGGRPTVCVPDPRTGNCVAPYVDHADVNGGGPHNSRSAVRDVNGGKMNGFIRQAEKGRKGCTDPFDPA